VTPLDKKSGPTHRPFGFRGCAFDREFQFYWWSEAHLFFVGNSGGPIFFVAVSTHNPLDNSGSLELSSCLNPRHSTGI